MRAEIAVLAHALAGCSRGSEKVLCSCFQGEEVSCAVLVLRFGTAPRVFAPGRGQRDWSGAWDAGSARSAAVGGSAGAACLSPSTTAERASVVWIEMAARLSSVSACIPKMKQQKWVTRSKTVLCASVMECV